MHYYYHLLNISLFLVWIILYFKRRDLDHQMFFMGLISAPLGLTEAFYARDYWHPIHMFGFVVGFEDLIFMFLFGGIAGVLYEELFMKKVVRSRITHHPYWIAGIAFFSLLFLYIGNISLHYNSIHVSLLILCVVGLTSLFLRPDLVPHAFITGLCMSVLFLGIYVIHLLFLPNLFQSWWFVNNLWGIYILHVPLEELLFAFFWGFVAGPLYELIFGLRLQTKK